MICFERLRDLGVPAGIRDAILGEGFDPSRPAIESAHEFARSFKPLLALAGPTRVGKTIAAAVAAAEARAPGRQEYALIPCEPVEPGAFMGVNGSHYLRVPVMVGAGALLPGLWLHAPRMFENLFSEPFWTAAVRAPVLVVDDLGLEPQDARVRDRVVGLLVGRYDAARPTIVTTNLNAQAFRTTYASGAGERLAARLTGSWFNVKPLDSAVKAAS